jgi:hypothetical protein
MQIDLPHLHYWMQAIRQSPDPIRTLDAFWSGQIKSKEWLITQLAPFINKRVNVDIHGGWVGTLASMLFQSSIPVDTIRSIDIDYTCEATSTMMNMAEALVGRFKAITCDMCTIESYADVIINTSCEHITQAQYDQWLNAIPNGSLIVLQSNNYKIPEHIRNADSIEEFIAQSAINVLFSDSLKLPLYSRYMIIGRKYVSV